jgi:hypothetical protein
MTLLLDHSFHHFGKGKLMLANRVKICRPERVKDIKK